MPIQVTCQCGKKLILKDERVGKRAKCPACGHILPPLASLATPEEPCKTAKVTPLKGAEHVAEPSQPNEKKATHHEEWRRWRWVAFGSLAILLPGLAMLVWSLLPGEEQKKDEPTIAKKDGSSLRKDAPPTDPSKPNANKVKDSKPETSDNLALAARVHEILKTNCYRWHGQDGKNEGGFNFVLDLKALVTRKRVIPGDPGKSKLFRRIIKEDDPMPPVEETVRPSKDDVATLKQWIESGAPAGQSEPGGRDFVSETDILQLIHDDLQKVEKRSRRFTRYFTVTHLYNAGVSDDELQTYRHGLSKLVNSLSWGRQIEVPQPIDLARTVFRIDMRHYDWRPEQWKRIEVEYPYGIGLSTETARTVYAETESTSPYVRADWFVFAASRPPLYHDMLQLPKTDLELEKMLRVDAAANIRQETVARAGFNSSGVSRNNRLIERHKSGNGAYWKSYDFAGNTDRQNLFAVPLGPSVEQDAFKHDGGEIIFSLPNGLQGYLLTDAKGARIDKGPTAIVRDDRQPDSAVVNGVSCMSCHAKGVIFKADQIREHVLKNPNAFNKHIADTILALYPAKDKFDSLLREDAERFASAVEKTGAHLSKTEPIAALALRFTQELDLPMAAAEAGVKASDFVKVLEKSPELARVLGPLNTPGGTVQRDTFATAFPDLVDGLGDSSSVAPLNAVDLIKLLPVDTDAVLILEVTELRKTPLLKSALRKLRSGIRFVDLRDITTAVVTLQKKPGNFAQIEVFSVLRGRFDAKQVHAGLEKYAKEMGQKLVFHKVNDHIIYSGPGGFMAMPDGSTMVIGTLEDVKRSLVNQNSPSGTDRRRLEPAINESLVGKKHITLLATGHSLAMAAEFADNVAATPGERGDNAVRANLQLIERNALLLRAHFTFDANLSIHGTLDAKDDQGSREVHDRIQKILVGFRGNKLPQEFFGVFSAYREGNSVVIRGSIAGAAIEPLLKIAAP